ncbi:MAG: type II toxin-antitoxin system ParD family antitoxin [Crocinitomicaceae bacterium]|jgi:antitoxin ParD1/3/4|nr:type II toxin-antitoxin system ParD family antitoxin [Crocinitomicaceae bacterium]
MNVSLSPTFDTYIKKLLDDGMYNNASEVIRDALRLKMQQDELYHVKLESIRSAIVQGEQSGDSSAYSMQEIIKKAKKKAGLDA